MSISINLITYSHDKCKKVAAKIMRIPRKNVKIRENCRTDVTETLKAANQMAWVGRMNNIRNRAEEIILNELVYAL